MKDNGIISDDLSNLKTLLLSDDRNDFNKQINTTKSDILEIINKKVNEIKTLSHLLDKKNQTINSQLSDQIKALDENYKELKVQHKNHIDHLDSYFTQKVDELKKEQLQKYDLLEANIKKYNKTNLQEFTKQNKIIDDKSILLNQRIDSNENKFNIKHEQNLQALQEIKALQTEKNLNLEKKLQHELKNSTENLAKKLYGDFKVEVDCNNDEINKLIILIDEQKIKYQNQYNELKSEINSNIESLSSSLTQKISDNLSQQTQLIEKVSSRNFVEQLTSQFIIELLNTKANENPSSLAKIIGLILHKSFTVSSKEDHLNISKDLSPLIATQLCQMNEALPKNQQHLIQLISDNLPKAIELQNKSNAPHLPNSLAPLIGKGLQAQINDEKDKIVDALYPVIGSTISKYMAESMKELVHKINTKIEDALSFRKYFTRLKNKALGKISTDLTTDNSINADPQSIYLIHKKTGVVILDSHLDGSENSQKHMVGGMFSAITSFVNDWIEKEGENKAVDSIEYGDSKVIFEASGSLIIAVVVNFGDTQKLRSTLRVLLADLHLAEHQFIEDFSGDINSVPKRIQDIFKPLFTS